MHGQMGRLMAPEEGAIMIDISVLPEPIFLANCRRYRLTLPDLWKPEAHGYFRELTEQIRCEMPLPREVGGIRELGILLSPSAIKADPEAPVLPAILVQSFFCHHNPPRLMPGHSTLLPEGDRIGLDTSVPEPLLSLHRWSAFVAEQVLFALDHPDKSNLALSTISSQPG
ncbi:hypothetical protein GLS_c01580 [Gluconobacter oxydans DSM 3504]|uniref:Uncharacterized protein n=1 Tax=Gluconobacter oxydans DSM 3504 TaxID=1288313 RepID=A0A067Z0L4_GLUOY|nr:hypothetical protein GLS_c01580 [Gluconobacter oxydans DSM 3504]